MEERGPKALLYDQKWKWEMARETEGCECLKINTRYYDQQNQNQMESKKKKILGSCEKLWRPFWDSSLIFGWGRWKD